MKSKKFQKRVEDFVCERCSQRVQGGGYTDHCPNCLWSKHVDVNPGDRSSQCGGLMEPIGAEVKVDSYIVYYRCTKCGLRHRVKCASDDNMDEIVKIINQPLLK